MWPSRHSVLALPFATCDEIQNRVNRLPKQHRDVHNLKHLTHTAPLEKDEMLQLYLLAVTAILTISQNCGYSPNAHTGRNYRTTSLHAITDSNQGDSQTSRRRLLSQLATITSVSILSDTVLAEENDKAPADSYSIEKCSPGSKAACVSTSNVRNLDLYVPPWTFDVSPDEVMSRLKGSIVSDSNCKILKQDGNKYLLVEANRNDLFGSSDEIEFVVNEKDKVVFFRSRATNNENSDFGINKKRLEEIRKRAGIFGVMGEYMNSADAVSEGERGNGPLGQLKAFYGLQSGGGFEDVILE